MGLVKFGGKGGASENRPDLYYSIELAALGSFIRCFSTSPQFRIFFKKR